MRDLFIWHLESCQNCIDMEDLPLTDLERDEAQQKCFEDSIASQADRVYEEWRDRDLERQIK